MIFKVLSIFKKLETLSELLHICELKVLGKILCIRCYVELEYEDLIFLT